MRILLALLLSLPAIAEPLTDDFSADKRSDRKQLRGAWTFADGEARCVSDPELYKKYKNHGPILVWTRDYVDTTIEMEFKPTDCDRVVFTMNNLKEGHVFRVGLAKDKPLTQTGLLVWKGPSKNKQTKHTRIGAKGDVPKLAPLNNKWVKIRAELKGETLSIQVGDFKKTITDPTLTRKKENFTLSFAGGSMAVRNVTAK